MNGLARADTSVVGRWWWTVDWWTIVALVVLMAIGIVLVMAASPPVATRIGLMPFHFAQRQALFLVPALVIIVGVSMLGPTGVRRVAISGFCVAIVLTIATLGFGDSVNGARRWIHVGGILVQPSEILKPTFAVVSAVMLGAYHRTGDIRMGLASLGLLALVLALLAAQPDYGMAAVVVAVWFTQFFIAGMPLRWVALMGGAGTGLLGMAYVFAPHVASRIDRFLSPASGDNYQIDTALKAFAAGGTLGRGPGEGVVKNVLPDAHTDFIFAVAGEEFGMVAGLLIISIFAFVVLRGFTRLLHEGNYFIVLAASGLLAQFGLQAFVNMGVNLRLLPAKGMTLPFISYGGSSILALALGMGMLLALTRRHSTTAETRWMLNGGAPNTHVQA
jgi:cell division protein FtsW